MAVPSRTEHCEAERANFNIHANSSSVAIGLQFSTDPPDVAVGSSPTAVPHASCLAPSRVMVYHPVEAGRSSRSTAFKYAKFARIAINWIAVEPEGNNIISQELQKLLGPDFPEFTRTQRVMITAEEDSECWNILACSAISATHIEFCDGGVFRFTF